jgi:hypothetical protein
MRISRCNPLTRDGALLGGSAWKDWVCGALGVCAFCRALGMGSIGAADGSGWAWETERWAEFFAGGLGWGFVGGAWLRCP